MGESYSILQNDFYPKFSLEKFSFKNNYTNQFAISMISFCDIPLSQIKLHVNRYGWLFPLMAT